MASGSDIEASGKEVEVVYSENVGVGKSIPVNAYRFQDPEDDNAPKSALEKRLLLKQDLLIVPLAALIYLVTYLDRNSFGNGKLLGLTKELHLDANQYADAAQLFYVGYVVFMIPANIILRTIEPYIIFGAAIISFGTFLCGMSAAKNFATVLVLRMLIGAGQAFVQGIGMSTSLWYKRREIALRGAIYYSTATLSGAFSGLIAYGIGKNMTNTSRSPWQWLFLIEGLIAVGSGILVLALFPPFPDKMKNGENWLFTKEEIELAKERSKSFNTEGSKFEFHQVIAAIKDPKTWAYAFMNAGIGMCLSTVSIFLPSFIADFGYTDLNAQLFSVIPYACAFVILPSCAFISDKINKKGPFIIGGLVFACIGYIILLTTAPVGAKMMATCFITSGLYTCIVLTVTWLGINTGGFTKRGFTWGVAEVFAQVFSIMGTKLYKYPPRYLQGHSIMLAFLLFATLNGALLWWWMAYCNKKKDRILEEYASRNEVHPHAEKSLEEVYDYHIYFRYTL
ncbi:hypothetical protein H072_137 [Dactylellina haptotyla CBS 200.50]|uniref:Major facilitator superfamily (MFS) profile domain-containing protein n=1 Tax=Dactylellina haptotyla (strain CBS 200.50) TaxID=1284197 RepID=S8C1Z3_DACHA|nr:hypothetical protein H072_137 [Dactylellina haptotyla CBS 200.50]